jgi:hypothetical protein
MKAYGVKNYGQHKNGMYPHGVACAICRSRMYPKKHKSQKAAARRLNKIQI